MQRVAPQWQAAPRRCWVASTCCPPCTWPDGPSLAGSSRRSPDQRAWVCHYITCSCATKS
eukprot:3667125-Pyramimonas_sp.AAC.1